MGTEVDLDSKWEFFECCVCLNGKDGKCEVRPNGLTTGDEGCQSGDNQKNDNRGRFNSFHDTDCNDDVSWEPVASMLRDVRNFDFRPKNDAAKCDDDSVSDNGSHPGCKNRESESEPSQFPVTTV